MLRMACRSIIAVTDFEWGLDVGACCLIVLCLVIADRCALMPAGCLKDWRGRRQGRDVRSGCGKADSRSGRAHGGAHQHQD